MKWRMEWAQKKRTISAQIEGANFNAINNTSHTNSLNFPHTFICNFSPMKKQASMSFASQNFAESHGAPSITTSFSKEASEFQDFIASDIKSFGMVWAVLLLRFAYD